MTPRHDRTICDQILKLLQALERAHGMTNQQIAAALATSTKTVTDWRSGEKTSSSVTLRRLLIVQDIAQAVADFIGPICRRGHVGWFFTIPQPQLGDVIPGKYLIKRGESGRNRVMDAARKFADDIISERIVMPNKDDIPLTPDEAYARMLSWITILEPCFSLSEIGEFLAPRQMFAQQPGRMVKALLTQDILATHLQLRQLEQAAEAVTKLSRRYPCDQVRTIMRDRRATHKKITMRQYIASQKDDKASQRWTAFYVNLICRRMANV